VKEANRKTYCLFPENQHSEQSVKQSGAEFNIYDSIINQDLLTMKLFVQYADTVSDVVHLEMWDLDLPNHLAGHKRKLLQLKFRNVKDLIAVRQVCCCCSNPFHFSCNFVFRVQEITRQVERNNEKRKERDCAVPSSVPTKPSTITNRLQVRAICSVFGCQ
jgi:hypothetical protein